MNNFPYTPASKTSLSKRKPIFGVGINDSDYITQTKINGKLAQCPYYRAWTGILVRCYSFKYHKRQPTYIGCSVVDDWLTFSIFKSWMEKHDWQGKQLDKDLLTIGNKVYSPETCVFVDRHTNSLLSDSAAIRGDYPQGVCFQKKAGKYQATISINGKSNHLGLFTSPETAESAYKKAKAGEIERVAYLQTDFRITEALLLRADRLINSINHAKTQ